MIPERFHLLERILQQRQPDLRILMDEVHKTHNFSAIVRSCDAVGVSQVHYVPTSGGLKISSGLALGSQKWVHVNKHSNLNQAVEVLKKQNFTIIAANASEKAIDFRSYDFTQPTVVLMGSELTGVSDKALTLCDQEIKIPMLGMVESLNVSVACATILYEAQRQRSLAGMYDKSRIDSDQYNKTLFEWAHPKIALHCRNKNLPYPAMNDEGEITEKIPGSSSLPL
ncbi:MAG: tRNA (guanosine(18)-2'-O)-methyltransferase TrmH [bacterium]